MKPTTRINVCCAIIEHNGRILAAQRADKPHGEGSWEFPGGKVEKDESLEDCIRREIKEELSIEISIVGQLATTFHYQAEKVIVLHPFICYYNGKKIIPREHHQIKWILPGEFYDLDWLVADKDVWENYLSFRKPNYLTSD